MKKIKETTAMEWVTIQRPVHREVERLKSVTLELTVDEIEFLYKTLQDNLHFKKTLHDISQAYYPTETNDYPEEFKFMVETFKNTIYKKNKEKYGL